jgi:hypothetical protein
MGIRTAPAWFQRCVDIMMTDVVARGSLKIYMDDLMLHTTTLQEHLVEARALIDAIKQAGLLLARKKCDLVKEKQVFIGREVSHQKICNSPARAACIRNMPQPTTYKGVQNALGIFGYQREFINKYSDETKALYDLLLIEKVPPQWRKRNGTAKPSFVVTWTDDAMHAFNRMKDLTSSSLELYQADFDYDLKLGTDASEGGYGGYLYQDFTGQVRVIGYFSKTCTKAQKNYATNEKNFSLWS